MKVAAFVPAKGTSERIESKNLQILDGEYLFKRKLRQLLECREIDEVWLDSEDDHIHKLADDLPIKHLRRNPKLADNDTDGHAMFENETRYTDADIVVQALCTAPFIDREIIDPALSKLKASKQTSLIAVSEQKLYRWLDGKPIYGDKIPNSEDLETDIVEAMSFYAVKTNGKPYSKRYTNDVILFPVVPRQQVDINNVGDLEFARTICLGERMGRVHLMKLLSKNISSCLLSDICKELDIEHYIGSNIKAMNNKPFLGYAKTLKLKKLNKGDDWEGIFDALDSYSFVEPGDVIVVSNDVKEKAYFGDLNAHFACRNGAAGVVVDGHTRDVRRVTELGLPLYAHGTMADDIRYEGTLEEMNKPVDIDGVLVRNNDLIFGDSDGVICIPREEWPNVLSNVKIAMQKEMAVKFEATFGSHPKDILNRIGTF
jgi:regulator of RNase E activity RraA/CMP-N-acetylneuraminic acid synthetase